MSSAFTVADVSDCEVSVVRGPEGRSKGGNSVDSSAATHLSLSDKVPYHPSLFVVATVNSTAKPPVVSAPYTKASWGPAWMTVGKAWSFPTTFFAQVLRHLEIRRHGFWPPPPTEGTACSPLGGVLGCANLIARPATPSGLRDQQRHWHIAELHCVRHDEDVVQVPIDVPALARVHDSPPPAVCIGRREFKSSAFWKSSATLLG